MRLTATEPSPEPRSTCPRSRPVANRSIAARIYSAWAVSSMPCVRLLPVQGGFDDRLVTADRRDRSCSAAQVVPNVSDPSSPSSTISSPRTPRTPGECNRRLPTPRAILAGGAEDLTAEQAETEDAGVRKPATSRSAPLADWWFVGLRISTDLAIGLVPRERRA